MEGVQFSKPLVVAVDALEDDVRGRERVHGALDVGVDGHVVCHQPDVALFWFPRSRLEDEGTPEEVVGGGISQPRAGSDGFVNNRSSGSNSSGSTGSTRAGLGQVRVRQASSPGHQVQRPGRRVWSPPRTGLYSFWRFLTVNFSPSHVLQRSGGCQGTR